MVEAAGASGTVGRGMRGSRRNTAVYADLHLDVVTRSLAEGRSYKGVTSTSSHGVRDRMSAL